MFPHQVSLAYREADSPNCPEKFCDHLQDFLLKIYDKRETDGMGNDGIGGISRKSA